MCKSTHVYVAYYVPALTGLSEKKGQVECVNFQRCICMSSQTRSQITRQICATLLSLSRVGGFLSTVGSRHSSSPNTRHISSNTEWPASLSQQSPLLDRRRHGSLHTQLTEAPAKVDKSVTIRSPQSPPFQTSVAAEDSIVKLNYIEMRAREEEAIPVVILHGLLGQSRNFKSWASNLHERLTRGRSILVPDLRNHGSSGHAPRMSYREIVGDVMHLLDTQGIERAIWIGHSMGGKAALAAALTQPDRVAGLVAMDIAPVMYSVTDGTKWQETHQVIDILSRMSLKEIPDKATADRTLVDMGLTDSGMRAFVLTNLAQGERHMTWQINVDGIRRSLGDIASFDVGDLALAGSSVATVYPGKTMFLNGGKSKYLRSGHLAVIAQLFPRFSLATIRQAGHWVHAEAPEDTLRLVLKYLDEEAEE